MFEFLKNLFTRRKAPKGALSLNDVMMNASNEVPVTDYPRELYTHTWEKILSQSDDRIIVELRFFNRDTSVYEPSVWLADVTLLKVTKQCNAIIKDRMKNFRRS